MSHESQSNPSEVKTKATRSGEKFRSEHGIAAIKDGIKATSGHAENAPIQRKPKWLRAQIPGGQRFEAVKANVRSHKLSTVCEESHCPNMG